MLPKLTLRLCAFLLLASFGSSATACGLFPFLNPFAWTCGYGCGYGYGSGYSGYNACRPWYGGGWGYSGYGTAYRGGYPGWHGAAYSPGYPTIGAASDCDCGPGAITPTTHPASAGAAWPTSAMTAQSAPWSNPGGWRPQYQWTRPGTAWQAQPNSYGWQAPQTAMSTAPVYGPTWELPGPATQSSPRVAGDILGDHELPVIPNGFQSATGIPVHPASYRPVPRPVRRYSGVVR